MGLARPIGDHLRECRRRMSQLDLACEAEITLSELALESFFPADAATADALRRLADGW